MQRQHGWKRYRTAALITGAGLLLFLGFTLNGNDYFFQIGKSIEIFGHVYREIATNYVDDIDPVKFMESGIDGMLSSLDPYTDFINEQSGDEIELITSGKYGGIGVTIGVRDGYITILSLMEGYSAARQGLLPGDRIISINGTTVTGSKPENIRSMTRGEPGTEVHLTVQREGEPGALDFSVVREEIELKNVSYADFVSEGIGYIHLEHFSRNAGDEVRSAIRDLQLKGTIRGIILDLRDNPGGLLDEAVDVVEKFAPKGSLVVSTRGRKPESEKKFFAEEDPLLGGIPMVVLVNRGSASASEIVAGAIQDLDRGIILGTRTFGKGLVQTITPLPYNTQLKITTAKYYTPSGRCIQEIDYSKRDKDGIFAAVPDSTRKSFKTLKGRLEYEAGGIQPDTLVNDYEHTPLYGALVRRSMFFRFATRFASQHHTTIPADDTLMAQFKHFIADEKFVYQDEGTERLRALDSVAQRSKYSEDVKAALHQIREKIVTQESQIGTENRGELTEALKLELIGRLHGERGRVGASLENDRQVAAAVSILKDKQHYATLLSSR
jgi:carboxyl-terminal processing protease